MVKNTDILWEQLESWQSNTGVLACLPENVGQPTQILKNTLQVHSGRVPGLITVQPKDHDIFDGVLLGTNIWNVSNPSTCSFFELNDCSFLLDHFDLAD